MAFLHARGLAVDPEALTPAIRAAFERYEALYHAAPGHEGLTEVEAAIARAGGLETGPVPSGKDPFLLGIAAYANLTATGLTTRQAAGQLGVSDARIRQRILDGTLLAVREGRAWKLPLFQFADGRELPGWATICSALPDEVSPVALESWLVLPHSDLGVGREETPISPRDWLLEGRPPEAVAALAEELA